MNRIFNHAIILSTPLLLAGCNQKHNKTGYIDINIIHQEYKLSQQYESYLKGLEDNIADELIDLQNQIKTQTDTLQKKKKRGIEFSQQELESYYLLKNTFNETRESKLKAIEDSTLKYRDLLNKDINKKVFQYGSKNQFQYVYNPAGSGTFMFADSSLNITDEVIIYLNQTIK